MNATAARSTIALVPVLGLAVWFSATAVGPAQRAERGIGVTAAAWLACSVQLGFVVGAVGAAVPVAGPPTGGAVGRRSSRRWS